MTVWIALLRGINVGGKNKLPMKELVALLEELDLEEVVTYIQSGNAVFRSAARGSTALSRRIGDGIFDAHGFRPAVLLIERGELKRVAAANPFPAAEREADGRALHVLFLGSNPTSVDHAALDAARHPSESWKIQGKALYLHAPEGIARSKLAAKLERVLGVTGTARNWRTVSKLIELASDY